MRNWTSFHSEMQFEDFSLERNDSMGIKGEIFFQPLSRAINENALILDVSLSVQEVLKRRFKKAIQEKDNFLSFQT